MSCMDEKLAVVQACIGLFQEPWTVRNKIKGVDSRRGNLFYSNRVNDKVRACIYVSKGINAMYLPQYSTGDLVAVKVEIETARGRRELVLVSAYLPYDAADLPPSREIANLVATCEMNSWELLVGADANAHHIAWSSIGVNARGEVLLGFICANQLEIINVGDKQTFVNRRRKEVIDITFGTSVAAELVTCWHVSDFLTISHHRRIYFDISALTVGPKPFRNPRRTSWSVFNRSFSECWADNGNVPRDAESIDDSVEKLNSALLTAFEKACPLITN
ncbi:uncharacterized protein LOC129808556 [Phlebotomus papatasi]|uniref:uncharacterized protein LOC129808556 n=1 Tax=Phlebotomus papatasi TaxID=29031 RepID=UPI002483EE5D|nr:uncharacterized protein LOC129808556 [Phlebotomus papatasi]